MLLLIPRIHRSKFWSGAKSPSTQSMVTLSNWALSRGYPVSPSIFGKTFSRLSNAATRITGMPTAKPFLITARLSNWLPCSILNSCWCPLRPAASPAPTRHPGRGSRRLRRFRRLRRPRALALSRPRALDLGPTPSARCTRSALTRMPNARRKRLGWSVPRSLTTRSSAISAANLATSGPTAPLRLPPRLLLLLLRPRPGPLASQFLLMLPSNRVRSARGPSLPPRPTLPRKSPKRSMRMV